METKLEYELSIIVDDYLWRLADAIAIGETHGLLSWPQRRPCSLCRKSKHQADPDDQQDILLASIESRYRRDCSRSSIP